MNPDPIPDTTELGKPSAMADASWKQYPRNNHIIATSGSVFALAIIVAVTSLLTRGELHPFGIVSVMHIIAANIAIMDVIDNPTFIYALSRLCSS